MMNRKYYYDTEANDDKSIRIKAITFANSIAEKDDSITRIVLYVATKKSIGWFEGIFSPAQIKQLFLGSRIKGIILPVKIETTITYRDSYSASDIVIAYGIRTKELRLLDDIQSAKYIISIPWIKADTEEWINSRNAINAETGEASLMALPSAVVCIALKDLTENINLSTGISHPMDSETAKRYIRVLYKYEKEKLEGDVIEAYLITHLHWEARHAVQVRELVDRLNEGKTFQGGSTASLDKLYEYWKEQINTRRE